MLMKCNGHGFIQLNSLVIHELCLRIAVQIRILSRVIEVAKRRCFAVQSPRSLIVLVGITISCLTQVIVRTEAHGLGRLNLRSFVPLQARNR